MIDFLINHKIAFQLVHLLGVMIALSGAFISDNTFFDYAHDSKITGEEVAKFVGPILQEA